MGSDRLGAAPLRVLIVDDHELVRDGLRHLLDGHEDLETVGEAGSLAEAVRRVVLDEPDVVILDVDLPDGSGVEGCRRITTVAPDVAVLMLTAYADVSALEAARQAGAAGFLLKRIRDLDLVEAIRRIGSGERVFDSPPQSPQYPNAMLGRLTPRELSILEQIAEGKTNREIAESLYLAEKTVKNYVSNLLLKLGVEHRAGAAAEYVRIRALASPSYPPTDWPGQTRPAGVKSGE